MTSSYRVFTRRFDKVLEPQDLDRELARMGLLRRQILTRAWEVFLEDSLEVRTTAGLRALEISGRLRERLTDDFRADTVVSLLVDHSGSMRGQNMLLAAVAVDVALNFLRSLGIKVEVLGYTTRAWRGGRARLLWALAGRRRNPGRLNDLLHLVYCPATEVELRAPASGDRRLMHMLRQDVLKENIDGEALEWAASRLAQRSETRRALVVISDGAPVDDSTLQANGDHYLADHLREVISRLTLDYSLAQLQIGDPWDSAFPKMTRVDAPDQLAIGLLDLLEQTLCETTAFSKPPPTGAIVPHD